MFTTHQLEQLLGQLPGLRIGLIGDLFLDRYLEIDEQFNELSIETGLTAYQVTQVRHYPGALGTVLNNLDALGVGAIVPISFVGFDGEGYELLENLRLRPTVDFTGLMQTHLRRTPTYTKPMLHETGQVRELNRLDMKNRTPTPESVEQELIRLIRQEWPRWDAVIALDQVSEAEHGVITSAVRDVIRELALQTPEKFVLADSRELIARFEGMCLKPNRNEMEMLQKFRPDATWPRTIFMTDGEQGLRVFPPGTVMTPASGIRIPGFPVSGPIDICGAGDSCSAALACAKMVGWDDESAAAFGNLIASITIQQLGVTGTASPAQALERWAQVQSTPQH